MVVDVPTTIRIDKKTQTLLNNREKDDDASYDDIVRRLLDKTETVIDLKEAVNRLHDEFEDVALITVTEIGDGGLIHLHVSAPIQREAAGWTDALSDADRIRIDGKKYWFDVIASPDLSPALSSVAVFADDNILGMEPLSVKDGVEQACEWVSDPDFSDPRITP